MLKHCVVRSSDSTLNPQPLNPLASFFIGRLFEWNEGKSPNSKPCMCFFHHFLFHSFIP